MRLPQFIYPLFVQEDLMIFIYVLKIILKNVSELHCNKKIFPNKIFQCV